MSSQGAASSPAESHAKARYNMVEGQIRPNRVTDSGLLAALGELPREQFVPEAVRGVAYVDTSVRLAEGRYLLEPLFLARLIQESGANSADSALIVGAGTGYSAAILSRLVQRVVAIESDTALAARARALLNGLGAHNVAVHEAPLAGGYAAAGPYDVILVDGMIGELPDALAGQLAEGGRLVTIKSQEGRCGAGMLYRKLGGRVSGRVLFDAFSPYLPGFEPQPAFVF